jgi:hypothetical protein
MNGLTREQLEVMAARLADEAIRRGARGVVVAVSSEEGDHSNYWVTHRGPCLEVEGLASRIAAYIGGIWNGKIKTRAFGATASVDEGGVVNETSVRSK